VRYWQIIANNLKKAGWNCGCIFKYGRRGPTVWVVAAEREDAGRFIVRADGKLTAFLELELVTAKQPERSDEVLGNHRRQSQQSGI
jgi:hypothetical protein